MRLPTAALALALACATAPAARAEPIALAKIVGPQTICLKYSAVQLAADEQVVGLDLALESAALTVSGPYGAYTLHESEIWGTPGHPPQPVLDRDGLTVFEDRSSGDLRYGLWGRTAFSHGRPWMVIGLSGPALRGLAEDRSILERVRIGDPRDFRCQRRYVYTQDADGPEKP